MSATDLAIRIATTLDSTGLARADKAVGKLQKSIKTLSGAIGGLAIAAFAKKSLSAFVDDELAATRLANAVKNLGMEFANPYISDYISNLEKTSQVADDMLRPAFQRLLQQTGSLAKSQAILNTAIEVSAGTGESLTSVSEDLAKAYYGNTRSLKKYSLGLTDAELKAKSFSTIQDELTKKFAGGANEKAATFEGTMARLKITFDELKEAAGTAFLPILQQLAESAIKVANAFGVKGFAGAIKELQYQLKYLLYDEQGQLNAAGEMLNKIVSIFNLGKGGKNLYDFLTFKPLADIVATGTTDFALNKGFTNKLQTQIDPRMMSAGRLPQAVQTQGPGIGAAARSGVVVNVYVSPLTDPTAVGRNVKKTLDALDRRGR